jgi:hypothetical protein
MGRAIDRYDRRDPSASPRDVPQAREWGRAVLDPRGTRWPSMSQAGSAYGLTSMAIRYRAAQRVAGWRFAEEG